MRNKTLNKTPKKRISNFFSVLGGADIEILEHVGSERSIFVGIGAVMLGTASVAALSMVFALYNAVLVVSDPSTGQRAEQQRLFAFEGVVGGANRILRRLPSGGP